MQRLNRVIRERFLLEVEQRRIVVLEGLNDRFLGGTSLPAPGMVLENHWLTEREFL